MRTIKVCTRGDTSSLESERTSLHTTCDDYLRHGMSEGKSRVLGRMPRSLAASKIDQIW